MSTNLNQHILEAIPLPVLSGQDEDEIRLCIRYYIECFPKWNLGPTPAHWVRQFQTSGFGDANVTEMKSHIDQLVDNGF